LNSSSTTTGWGSPLQENHPRIFPEKNGRPNRPAPARGARSGKIWWNSNSTSVKPLGPHRRFPARLVPARAWTDSARPPATKVPPSPGNNIHRPRAGGISGNDFSARRPGGSWDATESLLTERRDAVGLFRAVPEYSARTSRGYLDYAKTARTNASGSYIHYSKRTTTKRLRRTRERRAPSLHLSNARGRCWRNRLCASPVRAAASPSPAAWNWLATEKIRVHGPTTGLNWGAAENIRPRTPQLNELFPNHPCFLTVRSSRAWRAPVRGLCPASANPPEGLQARRQDHVFRFGCVFTNIDRGYRIWIETISIASPLARTHILRRISNFQISVISEGCVHQLAPALAESGSWPKTTASFERSAPLRKSLITRDR